MIDADDYCFCMNCRRDEEQAGQGCGRCTFKAQDKDRDNLINEQMDGPSSLSGGETDSISWPEISADKEEVLSLGIEQAKQGLGKPLCWNLEDDDEWLVRSDESLVHSDERGVRFNDPQRRLNLLCEAVNLIDKLFEKATNGKYNVLWKTKYNEIRFEWECLWLYVSDPDSDSLSLIADNRDLFLKCLAAVCSRYPEVAGELLQEALYGTLNLNSSNDDSGFDLVKYLEQELLPKERRLTKYGDEL